jgi:transposase InsO family protein
MMISPTSSGSRPNRLATSWTVIGCSRIRLWRRCAPGKSCPNSSTSTANGSPTKHQKRHSALLRTLSDNGREFISVWEDTLTKFGQLLKDNGVEHLNCAPYYPQGNGKAEAFIRTLNREVLFGRSFESLAELQTALENYLTFYNTYRHHSALG